MKTCSYVLFLGRSKPLSPVTRRVIPEERSDLGTWWLCCLDSVTLADPVKTTHSQAFLIFVHGDCHRLTWRLFCCPSPPASCQGLLIPEASYHSRINSLCRKGSAGCGPVVPSLHSPSPFFFLFLTLKVHCTSSSCPGIIAAWVLFLQVLPWLCASWGPLESFPDFISLTSVAGGIHTAGSVLFFIVCVHPQSHGYCDPTEHKSPGTQRGPSESWHCSLHRPWKARPRHKQTCVLVSKVVFTVFPQPSAPFPL